MPRKPNEIPGALFMLRLDWDKNFANAVVGIQPDREGNMALSGLVGRQNLNDILIHQMGDFLIFYLSLARIEKDNLRAVFRAPENGKYLQLWYIKADYISEWSNIADALAPVAARDECLGLAVHRFGGKVQIKKELPYPALLSGFSTLGVNAKIWTVLNKRPLA